MAYRDFTLESLRHRFGMTVHDRALFETMGDLVPSAWLRESLQKGSRPAAVSEKARSEFIVAPLLIECCERMPSGINIFSGIRLDADPDQGLNGECDFILARSSSAIVLRAPLMLILEAKRGDLEEGIPQCAAQLLGASRYGDREARPLPYLYGCVTNGQLWQFVKLQANELHRHTECYAINEVSKILWFIVQCLKDVDQRASDAA